MSLITLLTPMSPLHVPCLPCLQNVGDGKGLILDAAIQNITDGPKWALEIGTYCGYSAVRIGRLLPEGGKLISIEISVSVIGSYLHPSH